VQLTPEVIAAAIQGFEIQKRRIDLKIAELRPMLNSAHVSSFPEAAVRKPRRFSAAARERMRAAQLRRWARFRKESEPQAKPKRRLSPAGRRAIQEAQRRRWAQRQAEAANQQQATA
jgi:hypothetical protein